MANRQSNGFKASSESIANKIKCINSISAKKMLVGWTDGAKDNKGNSYAVIARTLEYGRSAGVSSKGRKYPAIPPRDFVGQFFSKFSNETKKQIRKALSELHKKQNVTLSDIDIALKRVGVFGVGDLQKAIVNGDYQANAPATIKSWLRNKSKSKIAKSVKANPRLVPTMGKKPLIDTGSLVQHVTYKIV